ncbi:DeoR/GlpR family DNA-binding transcription regulator [Lactobacillus sp. ESL0731]|uniref:DeoR/GlpR family DNA-binding transcription regulator n=1 Tax=unclassified Lactobacillus TaxID=2620435 RepID=UPI0023F979B1|nr:MULTISPECIES: DeoR/GlpR family DNA-binding transcription regulator [unclassified Lactobacillus]WEV51558.1 DeoR/GlpR family DNA-binding transcription regulator [Lactobacillus sp. ESL0700]WEV62686.1 DeoR/GlpR family DNA-binding transcription regulator [Lactobacillus sp. ESL0731]
MTQEQRLHEIRQMLERQNHLITRDLATHFNISFDTARRDVIQLVSTGQAIRVHGGLISNTDDEGLPFLTRNQIDSPIKTKMAQVAQHFIHSKQCDFIGPSTILKKLCQLISGTNLQIVTNSIDNSLELMRSEFPEILLLGGKVNKEHRFNYSVSALDSLKRISFNNAFVGTANVKSDGIYLPKISDAELIKVATSRAKRIIVVAEKHKFNNSKVAPYMAVPLSQIDVLITDEPLPDQLKQNFAPTTRIISVLKK